MNKQIIWCVAAGLTLAVGCAKSGGGQDTTKHEKISETALPQAVRDGFAKAHPGVKIEKVEKETYPNGTVHYEVEYRGADGKEKDVELNADGEVLDAH
ncbi:MAG: putative beta-lactamase-inhibitor-like, PepSY-like [Phycisphaerales bacterium]|jgi:uncharacterized membrane protein YkoI|nr:putative beta-lactamase-inhibitor-like, PepSY-like [Phycisphaerales bacterium]